MKKDTTSKFVDMFISMREITDGVEVDVVDDLQVYVQHKTTDVNEARYIKMLEMTGKPDKVNQSILKKILVPVM